MNPIQPACSKGQASQWQNIAEIHRTLKNAAVVMELNPSALVTAESLINCIPKDAPRPVSPAGAHALAVKLRIKDGTLTYRINRLIALGLVENQCLANGRRHCHRDNDGKIVEIYGISFEPMMERAEELAEQAEAIRSAEAERTRLRFNISCLRRGMGRIVDLVGTQDDRATWASLPERLTKLTLAELHRVVTVVKQLKADLEKRRAHRDRPEVSGDRPSNLETQYTTEQNLSDPCNPAMLAERARECGQDNARKTRPTCGLEHITPDMIWTILPDDWRIEMEMHGKPSLTNLIGTAYQRAQTMDVNPSAWAQAQSALGPAGAAILVLLADAQSQDRGGRIRSPGGWVRRMSERAESGAAHLHRTIFGLLNRKEASCLSAV